MDYDEDDVIEQVSDDDEDMEDRGRSRSRGDPVDADEPALEGYER